MLNYLNFLMHAVSVFINRTSISVFSFNLPLFLFFIRIFFFFFFARETILTLSIDKDLD